MKAGTKTKPTTETKHTPGPWKLDGGIMAKLEGHDVQITCISRTHWCGNMTAEEKRLEAIFSAQEPANARLIAAAPELLEALKNLVTFPLGTFQVEAALAAIAKATIS